MPTRLFNAMNPKESDMSGAPAAEVCLPAVGPSLVPVGHRGRLDGWFRGFAHATADRVGRPSVFLLAVATVVVWAATGPAFHYSDTWQLVINTSTTIVTFLMVFLIQNTQNRDAQAVHLKLDELIRANRHARNELLGLEGMSDDELAELQVEFTRLRDEVARRRTHHG
jgi:low affinity Fe/Cu permease